jgi:hypothetical protein
MGRLIEGGQSFVLRLYQNLLRISPQLVALTHAEHDPVSRNPGAVVRQIRTMVPIWRGRRLPMADPAPIEPNPAAARTVGVAPAAAPDAAPSAAGTTAPAASESAPALATDKPTLLERFDAEQAAKEKAADKSPDTAKAAEAKPPQPAEPSAPVEYKLELAEAAAIADPDGSMTASGCRRQAA